MPVLELSKKRKVAAHHQLLGWSIKRIVRELHINRSAVRHWCNVPYYDPDSSFSDDPRSGRKQIFTDAQAKEMVAEELETDEPGVVVAAAKRHSCNPSTITRTANRVGGVVSESEKVVIGETHREKRKSFCFKRFGCDHTKVAFLDHTPLYVPPYPEKRKLWRLSDSEVPVPKRPKRKHRSCVQMYLAADKDGWCEPMFSATEVQCKRRRKGESELGTRWELHSVTAKHVAADLKETVFPWMRSRGLTTLCMDNARIQQAQVALMEEEKIESTFFGGLPRNDDCGHPPNSPDVSLLDAAVFPQFKRRYSAVQPPPTSVPKAIEAAKRILDEMDGPTTCRKYVAHYDALMYGIYDDDGGKSHHIS